MIFGKTDKQSEREEAIREFRETRGVKTFVIIRKLHDGRFAILQNVWKFRAGLWLPSSKKIHTFSHCEYFEDQNRSDYADYLLRHCEISREEYLQEKSDILTELDKYGIALP